MAALDLQPVEEQPLDLQPVGQQPLDLQPAEPAAPADQPAGTPLRALAYGPVVGENTRATTVGPLGNTLETRDVALSPHLLKEYGGGPYSLGQVVDAHLGDSPLGQYRVADSSWFSPNKPTQNTIEFRDRNLSGQPVTIQPTAGLDLRDAKFDLGDANFALAQPHADLQGTPLPPAETPSAAQILGQDTAGMKAPGNLDPFNRPVLHNADGTVSTTRSFSIGTDAGEVLIPRIFDGKDHSEQDAIAHFNKTGENFGTFDSPESADAYATRMHDLQAARTPPAPPEISPAQAAWPNLQALRQGRIDTKQSQIDPGLIAYAHGLTTGGVSTAAGFGLASSLEGPNVAAAAATGPAAPLTLAGLNVLEFLGGMLLADKAVSKGEKAILPHSETLRAINEAAQAHPTAEEAGRLTAQTPFLAKSIKGYYDLIRNAPTVGRGLARAGGAATAGGAAGAVAETARPYLEKVMNIAGQQLGFSPEQIQDRSFKNYIKSIALGAALAGRDMGPTYRYPVMRPVAAEEVRPNQLPTSERAIVPYRGRPAPPTETLPLPSRPSPRPPLLLQAPPTPPANIAQPPKGKAPKAPKVEGGFGDAFDESPLVQAIIEHGGITSATTAKKLMGPEKWARNKAEWDGAPDFKDPRHNKIYASKAVSYTTRDKATGEAKVKVKKVGAEGRAPDVMAANLADEHLISDGYVDTMWAAIQRESDSAIRMNAARRAQAQDQAKAQGVEAQQDYAFRAAIAKPEKGEVPIHATELNIDDTVNVNGVDLKVTDIDEHTGALTLEDGKEYGVQHVAGDLVFYGKVIPQKEFTKVGAKDVAQTPGKDDVAGMSKAELLAEDDKWAGGIEGVPKVVDWEQLPKKDPAEIMPAPEKKVYAAESAGAKSPDAPAPEIPKAEADARIAQWKAEAQRIGREEDHSNEVIISLFDHTGVWSKPYEEAGYQVVRYDIKDGHDLVRFFPSGEIVAMREAGFHVKGVLAAPPCTSFAVSGARWWKTQHDVPGLVGEKYGMWATEYFDTPLEYAQTLVHIVEAVVEFTNPDFHAMENPIGRIKTAANLPDPLLTFQPHHYGDPYTKETQLWGDFNPDLPTANVEPTEGSKIHKLRGDVEADKEARSKTPEGFAYAFFMANHGGEPRPVEAPKLRRGETQGDLLQGPDQPFNLAGQRGTDFGAQQAAADAAAKAKAEADALAAQQQGTFENDWTGATAQQASVQLRGADMGRAVRMLGEKLYSQSLGKTTGKELFQNAVDAVMKDPAGPKVVAVGASYGQPYVAMSDTGVGMTPETVLEKFLPAFVSGKGVGAGGGFGMAKLAFLGAPKRWRVVTIADAPGGGSTVTALEGSGQGYLNFVENPPSVDVQPGKIIHLSDDMRMIYTENPHRLQSGTASVFELNSDTDAVNAEYFIDAAKKYVPDVTTRPITNISRAFDAKLTDTVETGSLRDAGQRAGFAYGPPEKLTQSYGVLKSFDTPSGSIDVIAPEGSTMDSSRYHYVSILNRGILQFRTSFDFPEAVTLPQNLAVNIKPTVDAASADYPFTTSREELVGSVKQTLHKFFGEVGAEERNKILDRYRNAEADAPPLTDHPGMHFLDVSQNAPHELIKEIAASPPINTVMGTVARIQDSILKMLKREYPNTSQFGRAKMAGMITGGNAYGVHFGKATGESKIFHDPFLTWSDAVKDQTAFLLSNPQLANTLSESDMRGMRFDRFLAKTAGIALHEALHQVVSSEGESLARELTFKSGNLVGAVAHIIGEEYGDRQIEAVSTALEHYGSEARTVPR